MSKQTPNTSTTSAGGSTRLTRPPQHVRTSSGITAHNNTSNTNELNLSSTSSSHSAVSSSDPHHQHPQQQQQHAMYSSAVYGQRLNKSRCMAPVKGDTQNNRFLVGTCSLNSNNEVHLIEFNEEENDIYCRQVYSHLNEIWSISPHPSKPKYFFTIYNTVKFGFEAALHGMSCYSDDGSCHDDDDHNNLEVISKLEAKQFDNERVHEVLWDLNGTNDRFLTIDDKSLREFRFEKTCKFQNKYDMGGRRLRTGAWDPHHSEIVAVAAQTKIIQVDLREKNNKKNLEFMAHDQMVRDVQYNPYQPYRLASCGDDCLIKFWDVRSTKEPLLVLAGHSHWISKIRFNPQYDQLVLTGGTDNKVNLWSIASISSKYKEQELEEELQQESTTSTGVKPKKEELFDSLVHSYDEHEESVYSLCWSNTNSWTFGSVSYDGRVLMHTVPKAEKLRVLNL
ncbi:hypothetical protein FDP41_010641 [Naegleria fowleri]|uniref:EIPR1-like beta-propeller domain-containing protein n=1 Tax=Naegleria fowleri TaxID=5763 RepID=A0A6A5C748_NAEFO|nr:uncharacterized protein FDP41_010641 [Naegleria fowleri]KAF0983576.1 hypothetical protein FDP41_010641 [Naegleria fowleri]CAG4707857.1 unnamed protein product [Naegleria fowleri]